jgi:hypothetical protein
MSLNLRPGSWCSAILFFCAVTIASAAPMKIEQLWSAASGEVMESAAIVVDLNGDGDDEIITASYENIIAYDGSGKELWRYDTRGRYSTCPAVLERPGSTPLLYAADHRGMLSCLDGDGKAVWKADIAPVFCTSGALADIDADGMVEYVIPQQNGDVSVFDALTGKLRWKTKIAQFGSSPAVGDLNADGKLDIVIVTTKGTVYALDYTGKVLWTFALNATALDWSNSSPVMFASSAGDVRVVAASGNARVYCLDASGNVLWQHTTRGNVASALSVGDFNANGRADVFAVTQLGQVYRFDEDGRILWDIDMQGRSLASGAIIDLDGDGALDFLVNTQRGNMLAFDQTGSVVYNEQLPCRTINVTSAFGDIVKDRPGLEFAFTGGESGKMYCYGVSGAVTTSAPWRTYRGDNHRTGAWFGLVSSDNVTMTPVNVAWDRLLTGDDITFRITNPKPTRSALLASVSCISPDGSRQAAVTKVVGSGGELRMPLTVAAPGIYQFAWSLVDSAETKLVTGSSAVTLTPYINDVALSTRAVLALRDAIGIKSVSKRDRGIRGAMRREMMEITAESNKLVRLHKAVPGSSPVFGAQVDSMTIALNARAKRAMALAKVSGPVMAKASGSSLVPFEGITWENRDVHLQIPTEAAIPLKIMRRAVVGEHEPVSVKLFNVTLGDANIIAKVKTNTSGPKVTVFEVKPVPVNANQKGPAWDPLVPLTKKGMMVPSLETREVWLDIDLAGVEAGTHNVNVTLGKGKSAARVEITLEVLPFDMAGFGAMRLCNWASYKKNAVQDLLAHNNNVFIYGLPAAKIVSADPLKIEIDFKALDEFVVQLKGWDVFLLMGGQPNMGVKRDDPAYIPRFREYITQVFAHLATHGIDEKHIALYPHDEPGGQGWDTVKDYIAFGRVALKAYPGLQFYVNGGGGLPMAQALNEVASVWCQGYYQMAEGVPGAKFQKTTGKTLWTYDCGYSYARPVGVNVKTINVVSQFRMTAVHALGFGVTGIGYFSYNHGGSMWGPIAEEYSLVYVNPDGTTTSSRRWEGVREGMEDARILIALKAKLSDPSVSADAKAKIRHLLDVTVPRVTWQALDGVFMGVARYVLDAAGNDATVSEFRREMMDCVAAVSAK